METSKPYELQPYELQHLNLRKQTREQIITSAEFNCTLSIVNALLVSRSQETISLNRPNSYKAKVIISEAIAIREELIKNIRDNNEQA